jgi:hypothetical protein
VSFWLLLADGKGPTLSQLLFSFRADPVRIPQPSSLWTASVREARRTPRPIAIILEQTVRSGRTPASPTRSGSAGDPTLGNRPRQSFRQGPGD